MTPVRSLPIRLDPVDGESIDSYLEACAARMRTTHGDVVDAVGIEHKLTGHRALAPWIVRLSSSEVTTASAVTGVPAARLLTMTLADYDERSLRIDQHQARLAPGFPWGYTSGSRYCPHCLAENGGRWLLRWRLGWSFACMEHRCLLAHECPKCNLKQRLRVHAAREVPQPGKCANGDTRKAEPRCAADLATAAVLQLGEEHPALEAQRTVYSIIDGTRSSVGLYVDTKYSSADMLSDLRDLVREALRHSDRTALARLASKDLVASFLVDPGTDVVDQHTHSASRAHLRLNSRQTAPRDSAATAVGVTAAWAVLSQPDVGSAAALFRPLLTSGTRRRQDFAPSWFLADRHITPTLTAVYLRTAEPFFSATDSRKMHTRLAPIAAQASAVASDLDRWLPTMLWEPWFGRMTPPRHRARTVR